MENIAQIRFTAKVVLPEGSMRRGSVHWFGCARAQHLIDTGVAQYMVPADVAATQRNADPSEKKFSGAGRDGPSTDSPKSTGPGTAPLSFASQADRVSTSVKSGASKTLGKLTRKKSGS